LEIGRLIEGVFADSFNSCVQHINKSDKEMNSGEASNRLSSDYVAVYGKKSEILAA
jgi:hypothetical protein